jgi:hypothetical protein
MPWRASAAILFGTQVSIAANLPKSALLQLTKQAS